MRLSNSTIGSERTSNEIVGFFMVPDNRIWNYNFIGIGLIPKMKYSLILGTPKQFYDEGHRVTHFVKFIRKNDEGEGDDVDFEDTFN